MNCTVVWDHMVKTESEWQELYDPSRSTCIENEGDAASNFLFCLDKSKRGASLYTPIMVYSLPL